MRIYTAHDGALAANAISRLSDGKDVEGHHYLILTGGSAQNITFQQGPVPKHGVNGVTNEALLAVLIHRTEFLDAKFPCDENKSALEYMRAALAAFEARTAARIARGVEGQEVA